MTAWNRSDVADEWRRNAESRNRYLAPATDAMFELARLEPGDRVLDLGTGAGDVAVMAAARVGSHGSVVATDASAAMVGAAQATLRDAGTSNATVRQMDVQAIDLPDASVDAVLARMVLMFIDDLPRALAGVARVLSPGGRFVAATWSALAQNPFHAALIGVAREHGPLPEPDEPRA